MGVEGLGGLTRVGFSLVSVERRCIGVGKYQARL